MANYDFSTLNSSDLEELVCDLLNAAQKSPSTIKYKTFKDGKDKGIDFLYSIPTKDYEHVGQVKHFYRTGYKKLKSVLEKDEFPKVVKLNPTKYIFATSVDLSVNETKEIEKIFNPYLKSLNDVYGKKDINKLIEEHEEILKQHFKLWFSDSSILSLILNSDIYFRSLFQEDELSKKIRLYVKTNIFETVRKALLDKKIIILTGNPGVGKTSLAEMLIYEYLKDGYQLTYIIDNIGDIERRLTNDNSKQIFYFDDFLGSTSVEIEKAKAGEATLRNLFRRIPKMDNKFLVLTTRSFLLEYAIEDSEKLRNINLKANTNKFEIIEYNNDLKIKLLKNHIEESDLGTDFISLLNSPEIQKFLINHKNFNPRSIEFITSSIHVENLTLAEFEIFIKTQFEFPDQIWNHAFTKQINIEARLLLLTLLSFGDSSSLYELEKAFSNRIKKEFSKGNSPSDVINFNTVLKVLDGGFITIKNNIVYFISPSLIDYLINFIQSNKNELIKIAESIVFISQLTERLFASKQNFKFDFPDFLKDALLNDYYGFVRKNHNDSDLIKVALVINKYVSDIKKEQIICEILEEVSNFESIFKNYQINLDFKELISTINNNSPIYTSINLRKEEIVNDLIVGNNNIEELITDIENLVRDLDVEFNKINTEKIVSHLDNLFSDLVSNDVEDLTEWVTDESEAINRKEEILTLSNRLNNAGLNYLVDLSEFDVDWYEIAIENEFRRIMAKDD